MTAVRGITSRVDIIWNRDGTEFKRMKDVSVNSRTGNMVMYTSDTYTISVTAEVTEFRCKVVINTIPPVVATNDILLAIGE